MNAFMAFPNLTISFGKTTVVNDTVLLQWSGEANNATVPYGVATFTIQNGLIQRQTEWMVVVPKGG